MKNKPVKIINLPDYEDIKGEEPGDTLLNLYNKLIPADMEKPVEIYCKKIRMNYDDCVKYIELEQKTFDDDPIKIGLIWMNSGPAGDRNVPPGKIYLMEEYMQSSNQEVSV